MTVRHSDVAPRASGIAAVENNNSMAMMGMDRTARLMGGVDLTAVSMPIITVLLLKIR